MVIADLHCHYPMHLLAESPRDETLRGMVRVRGRPGWVDRLRAAVLAFAARVLNFRRFSDRWRVSLDGLEKGDVRLVLSVLYEPFAEMDLDERLGSAPEDGYYDDLVERLDQVEEELARIDPGRERHLIVSGVDDLDEAIASRRIGVVHCVEGGFHLGGDVGEIDRRVAALAERGVAYITLAHLFWRRVATNAPAIPFLPDRLYDWIFRQPRGAGLTELGEAAVRAMYRHGVLIDLSHMREDALDETFDLLDDLDRERGADPREFPVIATHSGYRFARQAYMLSPDTIRRIAARDGIVGLILARHQLYHGRSVRRPDEIEGAVQAIGDHAEAIRRVTGSHDHVGIGSDLDGFIKPTVGGIEYVEDLAKLRPGLEARFPGHADAILAGNAARVLRRALAARA